MVKAGKKSFEKMFPNLAREIGGESTIPIDSVRTNPDDAEKSIVDRFHNYNPTVVDFIRKQLEDKGVRSFGPKKVEDYYFKLGGLC